MNGDTRDIIANHYIFYLHETTEDTLIKLFKHDIKSLEDLVDYKLLLSDLLTTGNEIYVDILMKVFISRMH